MPSGIIIFSGRENSLGYINNISTLRIDNLEKGYVRELIERKIDPPECFTFSEHISNLCFPDTLSKCLELYPDIKGKDTTYIESQLNKTIELSKKESYIDHLSDNKQAIIQSLIVLGIFDEYLYRDSFSLSQYPLFNEITKLAFIDIIVRSNSNILYGLRTNIDDNSQYTLSSKQKIYILNYFLHKIVNNSHIMNDSQICEKYFLNFISKYDSFDNSTTINRISKENLMHLFFSIFGFSDNNYIIQKLEKVDNTPIEDVKKAIIFIVKCLNKDACENDIINSFNESEYSNIGRYQNALCLVKANGLCFLGNYDEAIKIFNNLYSKINQINKNDWTYGKIIINNADALMMQGQFNKALSKYDEFISDDINSWNIRNIFDRERQSAHIYRFNMFLEEAKESYQNLAQKYSYSSNLYSYAMVGLLETICYTEPKYVFDNYNDILEICQQYNKKRSIAKIYYSLAISYTLIRNFNEAQKAIDRCIDNNDAARYPAGNIFAYLAKCYLDFARNNKIEYSSLFCLMDRLGVYQFFKLPIAIMLHDDNLRQECEDNFDWIDFNRTCRVYENFKNKLIGGIDL